MAEHRFCVTLMSDDFVWVVKRATATQPAIEYCVGLFFNDGTIYKNKVRVDGFEVRKEIPMYIWREIAKMMEEKFC